MTQDSIKAIELIQAHGAEIAQRILSDMLAEVSGKEAIDDIQNAIDELNILIQTDEKGLFSASPAAFSPSITRLPPAFSKGAVEVWLFDDAVVSFNKIANHFHGYRESGKKTYRLKPDELKLYRNLIDNPASLLDL